MRHLSILLLAFAIVFPAISASADDRPPWERPMRCIEFMPPQKEIGGFGLTSPAETDGAPDCAHLSSVGETCFCIDQKNLDARKDCCPSHTETPTCVDKAVICADGKASAVCTCNQGTSKAHFK